MPAFVLDTDTFSLLLKGHPRVCENVLGRPLDQTATKLSSSRIRQIVQTCHCRCPMRMGFCLREFMTRVSTICSKGLVNRHSETLCCNNSDGILWNCGSGRWLKRFLWMGAS